MKNTPQIPVLFFRGLNTYGDDLLHLGPFTFGDYEKHFVKRLAQEKSFIPVREMGVDSVEKMAERAQKYLKTQKLLSTETKFHLIGHSTGGLVARAFAHLEPERVQSLVTLGTPHHGTYAAEGGARVRPFTKSVLGLLRYDLETRKKHFEGLTPRALQAFNKNYKDLPQVTYASVLAEKPKDGGSLFTRFLEMQLNKERRPSDGLVPIESQAWGRILGRVELDHLEEVGYCFRLRPSSKLRFKREFERQLSLVVEFWNSFS